MGVSRREALIRLGLVTGSVVFVWALLELGLRLGGYVPERFPSARRVKNAGRKVLLDCYPTNPRGYFDIDLRDPAVFDRYQQLGVRRLERARHWAPHCVEFRYNSERFRDGEFGPRRPGARRVVVLGDSFTEGWGVKQGETYPRVLGRLLEATEPGRWELLNFGRRGEDFPGLTQHFERALRRNPDIVVYGMVLNDSEKTEAFAARQEHVNDWIQAEGRRARRRYRQLGPFQPRLLFLAQELLEAHRLRRESTRWYLEMYGEPNREGWERTQDHIRFMDQRLRQRGGRLLVATWPLLVDVDGKYPFASIHETIRRFCAGAGIAHHDLLPALQGSQAESLKVYPVDLHPNEIAHALAARSLEPVVRRLAEGGS
jgi:lysophospholipase L1-like esterase